MFSYGSSGGEIAKASRQHSVVPRASRKTLEQAQPMTSTELRILALGIETEENSVRPLFGSLNTESLNL